MLAIRRQEEYYRCSSFGTSAAVLVWTLLDNLSRGTVDALWFATIGLTEQFINDRIDM